MENRTQVEITGVDIPFGDLVALWVKVTLAAIPAALLLGLVALFIGACAAMLKG